MSKSCSGMLDEFIACVSESPCAQSKSLRECVKEDVPQCATKRELYFICKRGQVDMRNRIRGNKGY